MAVSHLQWPQHIPVDTKLTVLQALLAHQDHLVEVSGLVSCIFKMLVLFFGNILLQQSVRPSNIK